MSDIRAKVLNKDVRILNDFLAQKDIEFISMETRPMEFYVLYKKIKKQPKKSTAGNKNG